ncbi:MAG: zinc ribbon domain-containing protein [Bacteroidia bacterium]|nr:zinc ribbon domain-containing protein [Bacteroidia bacterium]
MADTFICPNCGTEVNVRARSCPECGADDETGWRDLSHSNAMDDDEFNYDSFIKDEFGKPGIKPKGMPWWIWILAILLIVALGLMFVR